MQAILTNMGTSETSGQELGTAKSVLRGRFEWQFHLPKVLARQWPVNSIPVYCSKIKAVTAAQVKAFAAANWTSEILITVMVGDVKK